MNALRGAPLRDGLVELILGFFNCTLIFCLLILTSNCIVTFDELQPSGAWLIWILTFLLVGLAEELMNRGFIMLILRRTSKPWLIVLVPSLIFGLMHLMNRGRRSYSSLISFWWVSYSYTCIINWGTCGCIGYHMAWNVFQPTIYGMPCSGLILSSLLGTEYPQLTF